MPHPLAMFNTWCVEEMCESYSGGNHISGEAISVGICSGVEGGSDALNTAGKGGGDNKQPIISSFSPPSNWQTPLD